MRARLHRLLLRLWGRLPGRVRRHIVRLASPSYTVGALCVIDRPDGKVLLVRHAYRAKWGLPGGLLEKREDPVVGARREVLEEVGLPVELRGEPAVFVDAERQRIDLVFRAVPESQAALAEVRPRSPEIIEAVWFAPDALPELQSETATALVTLARSIHQPQPLLDL